MNKYLTKYCQILIPLILCLFSCSNGQLINSDNLKILDVNVHSNSVFKVNYNRLIQLETTSDCLVGQVFRSEVYKNRIYTLDFLQTKTLYCFDGKGKFINKTVLGKGPGELIGPKDFAIIKSKNQILVHDQFGVNNILFDKNLNLIKEGDNIEPFQINNIHHVNQDTFLVYYSGSVNNTKKGDRYNSYSLFTNEFTEHSDFALTVNTNKGVVGLNNPITQIGNEILFISPYNYSIYELSGDKINERYQLDFGKYRLNESDMDELSHMEIIKLQNDGKKIGSIWSLHATKEFLVIMVSFKKVETYLIISLVTGRTYNLNQLIKQNLLPKGSIIGITELGEIVELVEPRDFMDFQRITEKFNEYNFDENDNPVILTFSADEII